MSARLTTALPVPGLRKRTINICYLTRLIEGQNEDRIKKKRESRVRFTVTNYY